MTFNRLKRFRDGREEARANKGDATTGGAISDAALREQAQHADELVERLLAGRVALLRDRTGAGKTVVALATAARMLEVDHIRHVWIVAPKRQSKADWHEEWNDFASDLTSFTFTTVHDISRGEQREAPPLTQRDLLILDEAHRGQQSPGSNYQALERLAGQGYVLLVSATPFQLSTDGLIRMLSLGSPQADVCDVFRDYGQSVTRLLHAWRTSRDAKAERVVAALDQVTAIVGPLEAALDRVSPPLMKSVPEARPPTCVTLEPPQSWLQAFHVAQLIPELLDGQHAGDMFRRRLASSSEAFWRGRVGEFIETLQDREAKTLTEHLRAALGQSVAHPKVEWTAKEVEEQLKKKHHHVLVFCVFKETQVAVAKALAHLGEDSVFAPNELADLRPALRDRFRSRSGRPMALIVRDNLSESINLDGGAPGLIHHDLPWNPARLVQRWGRVVRRGSNFELVPNDRHLAPLLPVEVDQRIKAVVHRRRQQIELMLPSDVTAATEDQEGVPWAGLLGAAPAGSS